MALFLSVAIHFGLLSLQVDMDSDVAFQEQFSVERAFDRLDNFMPEPLNPRDETSPGHAPRVLPPFKQKTFVAAKMKPASVLPSRKRGISTHPLTPKISPLPLTQVLQSGHPRQASPVLSKKSRKTENGGDLPGKIVIAPFAAQSLHVASIDKSKVKTLIETRAIPRYVDNPRPHYPEVARRKGWSGEVQLLVRVDKAGAVERLSVAQSSGFAVLDRAATRAVRRWRFAPAVRAGARVASEVVIPIDFRLPGSLNSDSSIQE
ncbi:energy transducer TonB [Geopsychrobacter electrodiphilus]|uniref:energy transducer TonB n=1 Tax=Geopsychrobacter electrodiphilus TaxID=225196 RepID=UPI00036C6616|nr:energy transducer TonB [Geopsychrobacter electrodiphilus]